MSGFIPKEKLTAYERWELAAFDETDAAPAAPEPATGDHDDDVEIPLRSRCLRPRKSSVSTARRAHPATPRATRKPCSRTR